MIDDTIAPTTDTRLVRNLSGSVVHRRGCSRTLHSKVIPWRWADDWSVNEIADAMLESGVRECRTCTPILWLLTDGGDA